jgi:hypothetical protein
VPILRLTDGEERLLLSVYDLWQHERLLINLKELEYDMMMAVWDCPRE